MKTTNIGNLTEISADSGKYLTESYPTYFHSFYTKKILVGDDTLDNYKEVTEAEKVKLEENDAKFVEPPKLFIDQWNVACNTYGKYNGVTGYFELNGLMDITYEEAVHIYNEGLRALGTTYVFNGYYNGFMGRTCLPIRVQSVQPELRGVFNAAYNLEVVSFSNTVAPIRHDELFSRCEKLRIVNGIISFERSSSKVSELVDINYNNKLLQEVRYSGLKSSITLQYSPKLSVESFKFLVENKSSKISDLLTVNVHPDVYSKLTDETNTEWFNLLTLAQEKNIQFVTI